MADYTNCPYCEVRTYDDERFDRCYWCFLIKRDGLLTALYEYMEDGRSRSYQRTGESMVRAYERMVASGDIDDDDAAQIIELDGARVLINSYDVERYATEPLSRSPSRGSGIGCLVSLTPFVLLAIAVLAVACGGVATPDVCPSLREQAYLVELGNSSKSLESTFFYLSDLFGQASNDLSLIVDPTWRVPFYVALDVVRADADAINAIEAPDRLQAFDQDVKIAAAAFVNYVDMLAAGVEAQDFALMGRAVGHQLAGNQSLDNATANLANFCDG